MISKPKNQVSLVRLAAFVLLVAGLGISASATRAGPTLPTCKILSSLLQGAWQNLSSAEHQQSFLDDRRTDLGAKSCAIALGEDARRQLYCRWSFDYRSGEARMWFRRLEHRIRECISLPTDIVEDSPVNHPDTFQQRRYLFRKGEIALSVKDKAGHGQSHVLFSLTSAETN